MQLSEASVLVTGGGSGLGYATVMHLAPKVAAVVGFDLNADAGGKLLAECGDNVRFVAGDALVDDDVLAAIETAAALAPLRGVVVCAGGAPKSMRTIGRDGTPHDRDLFARIQELNVQTSFNTLRLGAARMATNDPVTDGERGAIVMTSSIAAFEGQIGQLAYAAAKGAIVSMTLTAARDLAASGIRVNTIAPGTMHTSAWDGYDEIRQALEAKVPFPHRLGSPQEFAGLAEHLLTNGYLNGTVVRLDGAIRFDPK
jgi:NAD(P)-dependent dehydrogenase (short-subunit alcohol dehydrogenase family)